GPHAVVQPAHLHGRQRQGRGIGRQALKQPGSDEIADRGTDGRGPACQVTLERKELLCFHPRQSHKPARHPPPRKSANSTSSSTRNSEPVIPRNRPPSKPPSARWPSRRSVRPN